ncbi:RNA-binding protein [Nitratireductor sp. ZSWI3]|uniref:RNA-binding protein n=1 Tax=Nitratireductor sp. ZSWI3 TaxID=2966359 RepID=UPI002150582A|nr:RNA-binding protein [Nitratireductor sp. ZSWI3]MCR4268730.1 RNA-binding protein [Nitratireductor sp. ZSWI3]
MNDRTCIVTRTAQPAENLIRFVAGPDGMVVPDLKRNLPGRGCWVTADRAHVDKAAAKNLFARSLKAGVKPPENLGGLVDELLSKAALGALGLARKAGAVALGAAKVEAAVRSGKASAVLHALEASEDGVRKITAARRAVVHMGGPDVPAYKLFSEQELSLALGATNVIHAAVLGRDAGKAALKRVMALETFRGDFAEKPEAVALGTAEDVE